MNKIGCRRVLLAALVIGCCCSVVAALGFDFSDRDVVFDVRYTTQGKDLDSGRDYDRQSIDSYELISAVGGKLLWYMPEQGNCVTAMIFIPGRSNSGKVDCPLRRYGTASNWSESSSSSTFQTDARLQGEVLSLRGTWQETGRERSSGCGTGSTLDKKQVKVAVDLKIRLSGDSCQVIKYSRTWDEDEYVENDYGGGTTDRGTYRFHWDYTPMSGGNCKVNIRSKAPDTSKKPINPAPADC